VAGHRWDPGLCALKAPERDAVEWLTGRFAPRERPVPFAANVALRLRMHYYARVPWNRRGEPRCAFVYSDEPAYLRGWLERPGWTRVSATSAVETCGPPSAFGPASEAEVLALCRATPVSRDSALRILGLGGIDLKVASPAAGRVEARALFVSAGVSIDSLALTLSGPEGREIARHHEPHVRAFSREAARTFVLPSDAGNGPWTVRACFVDSEGFAVAATAGVGAGR
jgi:hypothetical protein